MLYLIINDINPKPKNIKEYVLNWSSLPSAYILKSSNSFFSDKFHVIKIWIAFYCHSKFS